MLVAPRLQKLHHGHVVGERGRGGDDLVEVGRDLQHFVQRLIEVARGAEIVERENESGAAAQARNRFGLRLERALEFQVDKLTSCGVRLGQDFQLRSQRSLELAAIVGAAAGTDGRDVLVGIEKTMDFGKRRQGLPQVVQTELEERVIPGHGLGGPEHVFDRVAAQCEADPRQAHRQEAGRDSGRKSQGHLFSTTARYYRGASPDATSTIAEPPRKALWAKGAKHPRNLDPSPGACYFSAVTLVFRER